MFCITAPFFILPYLLGRSSGAIIISTAAPTTSLSTDEIPTSIQTPPPVIDLEARDRAGGLCGYYRGDAASPYICYSGYSCVQDHDNNAIGCVQTNTKKELLGVVYTTCLNYNVYQQYSVGPRTGCCTNSKYPACVWNTYTGADAEGYTLIQCTQTYFQPGRLLAWDASTSGTAGPTTMFIGIQTAINNNSTNTSPTTSAPSPSSSSSGLSTSDKITLGTALGLGLPATIAGVIGTWYAYKSWKSKKSKQEDDQRPFLDHRSTGPSIIA
ncbi:uncharacterized protein GGS22DRAFT_167991 [Annulohypoxylon maeteangense]|uniref:uncharacterized protein n=1 Tax=Annulohypoxylon maeteangense TaxID=1927788 RepID=UPI002007BA0E|nr:uncharacterized protein GGS22DRAFT_167991 [Annulohypoxylon maeteangense]KAI0883150.1 hypothetical protein GGS22DRAFT_167991 [Annulohypoxylon maeteangense]